MPEFFNVLPPDEARARFLAHLSHRTPGECIATREALGFVTLHPIRSPQPLPAFPRSTMDGYAVRAADTYGASGALPALATVIGEVPMGQQAQLTVGPGEVAIVHTGGMIPSGADAVVPVEQTQPVSAPAADTALVATGDEIEVFKAVAAGENVLQVGEDIRPDDQILPAGHRLRPQDLGGLLALGLTEVQVAGRARVAILASGDEVVPPDQVAGPGQIRDINSYTIAAQVARAGGVGLPLGIVPDRFQALLAAAAQALAEHDMVVITAGSSVSVRDMTVQVIDRLGEPGVLLHGVATRPGKPTIVGIVQGKPVLGLPGNPVSAMIQFDMFGVPAIRRLQGASDPLLQPAVWARLGKNLPGASGREDYVPARLEQTREGLVAQPVFGKSNLIFTLINADGLIKIPLNRSGLPAGEWVEVRLF